MTIKEINSSESNKSFIFVVPWKINPIDCNFKYCIGLALNGDNNFLPRRFQFLFALLNIYHNSGKHRKWIMINLYSRHLTLSYLKQKKPI